MADKWKQIAMGTVISIAGVLGLTSCENKNENQEENKKPQTELSTENIAKHILKEVQVQGIPVEKKSTKANTPDSLLESVDIIIDEANQNKKHYEHPTYIAASQSASVEKMKDGTEMHYRARNFDSKKPELSSATTSYETGEYKTDTIITQSGDTLLQAGHNIKAKLNLKFAYGERTPDDSIREAKEKIEAQKEFENWTAEKSGKSDDEKWTVTERPDTHSATIEKPQTEQDPHWKEEGRYVKEEGRYVIVKNTTYDFPAPNSPDGKEISQKQQKPEKKKPPKGSIRKDALINALLEEKRGGRGGKK